MKSSRGGFDSGELNARSAKFLTLRITGSKEAKDAVKLTGQA